MLVIRANIRFQCLEISTGLFRGVFSCLSFFNFGQKKPGLQPKVERPKLSHLKKPSGPESFFFQGCFYVPLKSSGIVRLDWRKRKSFETCMMVCALKEAHESIACVKKSTQT